MHHLEIEITASFVRVVHPLKYCSNNANLSCLENDPSCWNEIYLHCQNLMGTSPVSMCLANMKHSNIKALLTFCLSNGMKHSYYDNIIS